MPKRIVFLVLILCAAAGGWLALRPRPAAQPAQGIAQAAAVDTAGFARAQGPRPFSFPQDHGPHPEFQTEWWYYTGNLQSAEGRRFGFQLTFFRRALLPPGRLAARASDWAAGQVYMAHFALSDVDGGQHQAFERLQRGAAGLAGAQAAPFQVWLDDWQVVEAAAPAPCAHPNAGPCAYRLQAAQDGLALDLRLVDTKGPALQGDQGFSRKGAGAGQASYYYSLTRLESAGTIQLAGQTYAVSGLSWMDHEFSTSALSKDQVGWDWFSIQLDDGSELMLFQIRRADGSLDPYSSGAWIAPNGQVSPLQRDDFQLDVTARWDSPRSGASYPAGWRLNVPRLGLALEVRPRLADQELNLSYAYWEGAVAVSGSSGGQSVAGSGYVELTGYSGSMGGEF